MEKLGGNERITFIQPYQHDIALFEETVGAARPQPVTLKAGRAQDGASNANRGPHFRDARTHLAGGKTGGNGKAKHNLVRKTFRPDNHGKPTYPALTRLRTEPLHVRQPSVVEQA